MTGRRNTWPCAWLLLAGVAAAVPPAAAERQPYDRYQSIVDRQMFGPLPAGFDPTKSPSEVSKSAGSASEKELTKEQEKVKSSIRFSVINVTPDGDTAIGFTDNSNPKAPVHYYMKVGESRGGWEVKEADAKAATMTIVKDGIEVSLSLGGDSSKGDAGGGKDAAAAGAQASRSPLLGTLGGRRKARFEREKAEADRLEKAMADREAKMKALEEDRARREEEEKAQRAAEREESRRQLLQIQEELRKAREARQSESKGKEPGGDGEAQPESE